MPIPVLEAQRGFRDHMERRPIEFVLREMQDRMTDVRTQVGALVGADPAILAMVPNATVAVNTVLRSLDLRPGDEIDHHEP